MSPWWCSVALAVDTVTFLTGQGPGQWEAGCYMAGAVPVWETATSCTGLGHVRASCLGVCKPWRFRERLLVALELLEHPAIPGWT